MFCAPVKLRYPVRRPTGRRRLLAVILALHAMAPYSAWAQGKPKAASQTGKGQQAPRTLAAQPGAKPVDAELPQTVSLVNGSEISRNELGRECLRRHGKDVLESMINKQLIVEQCRKQKVEVTDAEVDAEIDRMAQRFGLPTEQWLKMLQQERRITPKQYASEIVWPTVALRKLAAPRLEVTRHELIEAYETQFGPSVKVRVIACKSREKAAKVRQQALAKPAEFGNLAKEHSEDVNSASAKGLIQPIRKHTGDENMERVAFGMKPGEISEVLQVADQYVTLLCEEHLPARKVPLEDVQGLLTDALRDKKLRLSSNELFRGLQEASRVVNVFNDPAQSKSLPGIAAVVNEEKITLRDLTEECIARKGVEMLELMINRKVLEQVLLQKKIEVSQAELDEEVARAAVAMGKVDERGAADVNAWLESVTEEMNTTVEFYYHDAVWPSVALKKIVGDKVQVSDEDLQKGFDANFGPRVRCRAIVVTNQRKAQEVWEMARKNPTAEYFGDLAEQYSSEPGSKALRGEVPPIQRWGGEPLLEKEAFSLRPGELSSIVQLGDQFVILFCEGLTEPTEVKFEEVRDLLSEDIHEKKLRLAMSETFSQLKEQSEIDNYLTQTSHTPRPTAGSEPGKVSLAPHFEDKPGAAVRTGSVAPAGTAPAPAGPPQARPAQARPAQPAQKAPVRR